MKHRKVPKKQALAIFKSFLADGNKRVFERLELEFEDMSKGGTGGPLQIGHRWETVRAFYYPEWSDSDFSETLHALSNDENNSS